MALSPFEQLWLERVPDLIVALNVVLISIYAERTAILNWLIRIACKAPILVEEVAEIIHLHVTDPDDNEERATEIADLHYILEAEDATHECRRLAYTMLTDLLHRSVRDHDVTVPVIVSLNHVQIWSLGIR